MFSSFGERTKIRQARAELQLKHLNDENRPSKRSTCDMARSIVRCALWAPSQQSAVHAPPSASLQHVQQQRVHSDAERCNSLALTRRGLAPARGELPFGATFSRRIAASRTRTEYSKRGQRRPSRRRSCNAVGDAGSTRRSYGVNAAWREGKGCCGPPPM